MHNRSPNNEAAALCPPWRSTPHSKRPHPDALAASVLSEMVGAMAIARAMSDSARSEQILKDTRDSVKARMGLAKFNI